MAQPDWEQQVLDARKLEAVFLTNDFDDPLEGFDTKRYIPCLRTDDLVFHLAQARGPRSGWKRRPSIDVHDAQSLRNAIGKLFEHFVAKGARACAISLPPSSRPTPCSANAADKAIGIVARRSNCTTAVAAQFRLLDAGRVSARVQAAVRSDDRRQPRRLRGGVYQGQDLFDSRVSLIQYHELFNAFPQVTFPISVLASVTNQELVSYSWIFPNVVTNGHWWYSNTPAYIEHDAAARLEAVPQTKQIGYYSDMYKLEFGLPKFAMYKRILAKVLAERFVDRPRLERNGGRRPGPAGAARQRGTDFQHEIATKNTKKQYVVLLSLY